MWELLSTHVISAVYLTILGVIAVYGFHRYVLVYLYLKHRHDGYIPVGRFDSLPRVTVQLPMYNEDFVAERIIKAACQIDYPKEKLEIQVLDDSTDHSADIARKACEEMAALGHPIKYIHRGNRQGYKAGALAAGLLEAKGDYIAIFDADFIPPKDIFYNVVDYFTDPKIGMVQIRWDHLNRNASLLTKSQAIFLDGHFVIEHTARNRSGRFMHFNGTAGVWRRSTIDDAGGWQHDTLTEDLDLSYRAQLKGWQFVYLPQYAAPAELPPEIIGFKPVDQGVLPDRHQAAAAYFAVKASSAVDQDRSVFPSHLHRGLSADGDADAVDVSQLLLNLRTVPGTKLGTVVVQRQPVHPRNVLSKHILPLCPA
jgi:cellulose synthase/poly-beta-1,6-N-acetylglucosamine synthase-like glycosyltransferase